MSEFRKGGIRPAASLLKKLVSPAFRRQGFAEMQVVTGWNTIVGPLLAEHSVPERLRQGKDGGTLRIVVEGSYALEMQHLQDVIIDRINGYFGYRAVTRLSLVQAPLEAVSKKKRRIVEPSEEALAAAREEIQGDTSPALGEALTRLGGHVLSEKRAPVKNPSSGAASPIEESRDSD